MGLKATEADTPLSLTLFECCTTYSLGLFSLSGTPTLSTPTFTRQQNPRLLKSDCKQKQTRETKERVAEPINTSAHTNDYLLSHFQ